MFRAVSASKSSEEVAASSSVCMLDLTVQQNQVLRLARPNRQTPRQVGLVRTHSFHPNLRFDGLCFQKVSNVAWGSEDIAAYSHRVRLKTRVLSVCKIQQI